MRRILLLFLMVFLVLSPMATGEETQTSDALDLPLQLGFLFVEHFKQDLEDLAKHATWISEYDLAVALQLTALSDTELQQVVAWRREGSSWDAITRRCQLGCEAFYVELPNELVLSAPYARPYALWKQRPGSDQRLRDEEVRELVLLRAMSEYCQLPAEEIVRLRTAGQSPRAIVSVHPPRPQSEYSAPPLPKLPRSNKR